MWGPEGVTRAVAANLAAGLPAAVARIRDRYSVDELALPDVESIYPTPRDFASIEAYPAVMIAAQETQGQLYTRQTDALTEYDEYTMTYRVRALLFVMGTSFDQTELLTQRLTLAVREALLVNKRYGNPEGGDGAELDPKLLRESYAEAAESKTGYLGGSWIEIGLRSTERLHLGLQTAPVTSLGTSLEAYSTGDALPADDDPFWGS
jgi:hypothetical protein